MGRIIFTDGIGRAVLHNGKPLAANRFSNWKPNPMPIGDKANRQSDGALTMFRYRDDFGATFDLVGIPVRGEGVNLVAATLGDGDIAGTVGALPSSMAVSSPNTVIVALGGASGVPRAYGYNAFVAKHTNQSGVTDDECGRFAVSGLNLTHHYQLVAAVYVPSTSTATAARITDNLGGGGSTAVDMTKKDQWQLLTSSSFVPTGSGGSMQLRITGAIGSIIYSDLWKLVDLDDPTLVRPLDLAERLAYWLENGGTCQVETGDVEGNIYTTCQLAPGATAQQPVLSDRKLLEYTMSFALTNIAASPARMRCHYL